jgi:hypothetical protein
VIRLLLVTLGAIWIAGVGAVALLAAAGLALHGIAR